MPSVASRESGDAPTWDHQARRDSELEGGAKANPTTRWSAIVPNSEKAPPPYAWRGAGDVASTLPSGVITYGATSYVPQTGQALQSEQVEPPGAPNGTGGGAKYTDQLEPSGIGATEERAACNASPESCVDDPYTLHEYSISGIEQAIGTVEGYLIEFHEAEIGQDVAGQGEGLLTAAGISIFISASHTTVKEWVEFFSYWDKTLKSDMGRLKNRGPKDAEYLDLGVWSYATVNRRTGETEYLPYAMQATWCWRRPRQWCSTNSRTHQVG